MWNNDLIQPFSEDFYFRRYNVKENTIKPRELTEQMFNESTFIINDCKEVTEIKMANLKDTAKAYVPPQTKNIADLEVVNIETAIIEPRKGKNEAGEAFDFNVAVIGDEEYRVPNTVLKDIKAILSAKPGIKTIRVLKKGTGMGTSYTVVPLD